MIRAGGLETKRTEPMADELLLPTAGGVKAVCCVDELATEKYYVTSCEVAKAAVTISLARSNRYL